jgi:hypothetical protein
LAFQNPNPMTESTPPAALKEAVPAKKPAKGATPAAKAKSPAAKAPVAAVTKPAKPRAKKSGRPGGENSAEGSGEEDVHCGVGAARG